MPVFVSMVKLVLTGFITAVVSSNADSIWRIGRKPGREVPDGRSTRANEL